MPVVRIVDTLLNLLDRDRPCNQLYHRACELNNPDHQSSENREERTRKVEVLFAQASKACRKTHPQRHDIYLAHALASHACFEIDRSREMIDNAVNRLKEADKCWPQSDKKGIHYTNVQTNLGNVLLDRYLAFEAALDICPPTAHTEQLLALLLRGRAGCAKIRSLTDPSPTQLKQPIDDLNKAVRLSGIAKDRYLSGSCHYNLAVAHNLRYQATTAPEDLARAIVHDTQADGLLEGHPDHGSCLLNLARAYAFKYQVEMKVKSYKDPEAAQYLLRTQEMLNRAKRIGDEGVKQECEELQSTIRTFDRRNTTKVLALSPGAFRSDPTLLIPMPMRTTEEPASMVPDSAIGESPTI
ncbi:hypothetical protein BJ165DRAFT_1608318 [Panaeolus papilionaceus]|nr:hypothetical protein BJ165DRAFT_1608318 [Panaeolus papilionaceus]